MLNHEFHQKHELKNKTLTTPGKENRGSRSQPGLPALVSKKTLLAVRQYPPNFHTLLKANSLLRRVYHQILFHEKGYNLYPGRNSAGITVEV